MTPSELVDGLLRDLYPGDNPAVALVRRELSRVSATPGPVVVLLQGPPGTGKTTMARTIAVARRLICAAPPRLLPTLDRVRNEVLSQKPLTWFRDISLAGLVHPLADAQLFGIGERVATDVQPRVGIFEQAMTGHDPSEDIGTHERLLKAAKDKRRWAPLVTGGVVLLDEIGDLEVGLQPKLLRVLNRERVYRLGNEGNDANSFQYRGVTILATWRDLSTVRDFRPDLWQRISPNRIRVPEVSTYSDSHRIEIVRSIQRQLRDDISEELERLRHLSLGTTDEICSPDWLIHLGRSAKQALTPESETKLSKLDWAAVGGFRGLRSLVSRVMSGFSVEDASSQPSRAAGGFGDQSLEQQDLVILAKALSAPTLSVGLREWRVGWATRLNSLLRLRSPAVEGLIQTAGKRRAKVKKDLENLVRSESSDTTLDSE